MHIIHIIHLDIMKVYSMEIKKNISNKQRGLIIRVNNIKIHFIFNGVGVYYFFTILKQILKDLIKLEAIVL